MTKPDTCEDGEAESISVRAGIHTGECELINGKIGGAPSASAHA
jgi:hypothetical protein